MSLKEIGCKLNAVELTEDSKSLLAAVDEVLRMRERISQLEWENKHFKDCMDFREAALQASLAQTENALKQIRLLKSHAESMAGHLDYDDKVLEDYRKDFPKSTATDSL